MTAIVTHPQLKDVLFGFLSLPDVLKCREISNATADAVDNTIEEHCYEAMEGLNEIDKLCPYLSDEAASSLRRARAPAGFFLLALDNQGKVRGTAENEPDAIASEILSLPTALQRLTRFSKEGLIDSKDRRQQDPYRLSRLSMVSLARSAPNITSLYFWMCKLNDIKALRQTLSSLPHLQHLELGGDSLATFDDDVARVIATSAPKLKKIIIGIAPIAPGLDGLADCRQLESIVINSSGTTLKKKYIGDLVIHFPALKDVVLRTSMRDNPERELLDLVRRRRLRTVDVADFGWGTELASAASTIAETSGKMLESIHIGEYRYSRPGVTWLSDQFLGVLTSRCPFLKRFDVRDRGSRNVTDAGITLLGANCHQLQYLNVSGCDVGDLGINAIADGCPELQALIVLRTRVTDVSISRIALQCPKLCVFGFNDMGSEITERAFSAVVNHCPLLEIRGGRFSFGPEEAASLRRKHPRCYVR